MVQIALSIAGWDTLERSSQSTMSSSVEKSAIDLRVRADW